VGEIKSAIELAMERTKNLVMDESEKREASIRETEQRLTALVRRFMEEMIDERGFHEEYDKTSGEEGLKRSAAMDAIVEEVNGRAGDERLFCALSLVGGPGLADEVEALKGRFRREMEIQERRIRERIEKRLDAMGISGNAVEPNVPAWDEWKEAVEEGKNLLKRQVAEWKERLKVV
jgi:hypothetical protein